MLFSIFQNVFRGVKGQKVVQNNKTFGPLHDISGTMDRMIAICGTHV